MSIHTNAIVITDTTDATNTTTGALVVGGGVGVAKKTYMSKKCTVAKIGVAKGFFDFNGFIPNYYDDLSVDTMTGIAGISCTCLYPDGTMYGFGTGGVAIAWNPDTGLNTSITLSGLTADGACCVHPPSGHIYMTTAQRTLQVYNPQTGSFSTTGNITDIADRRTIGITYNPYDDKMYISTYTSTANNRVTFITYDVGNDVYDDTTYTGTASTASVTNHFHKSVCIAPNGKIYAAPRNQSIVPIIDPVAGTFDTTTITGLSGTNKYTDFKLAPDGYLYAFPNRGSSVLRLDYNNDAITTIVTGITVPGTIGHTSCLVSFDGNMYSISNQGLKGILRLDRNPPTFTNYLISGWSSFSTGGCPLINHPNGSMYGGASGPNTVFSIAMIAPPQYDSKLICNPIMNKT